MNKHKISFRETRKIHKHGVDIFLYGLGLDGSNMVYEETKEGHFEEFLNTVSTCMWFVIEGRGVFVLNDEKVPVEEKDIIVAPPNTRIHYFGNMRLILVSTPAFKAEDEHHIRTVSREESPFIHAEKNE